VRQYGTITAAWRQGLDVEGNGKVSFVEFSKQIRSIGFSGNIRRLFAELDVDNSGIITFNEVDREWSTKLSRFHKVVRAKHHSHQSVWKSIDANNTVCIEAPAFVKFVAELGYKDDANALFKQLLPNKGIKKLSLSDLESSEIIVLGNTEDPNANLKFHKRCADMLSADEQAREQLMETQAMKEVDKAKKIGACNWNGLKEQLIRKHGTITAAWRHGLDLSGNGKLSWTEFNRMCRDNSFEGNVTECFKEINVDGSGVILFDEVDHDWFVQLKQFRDLLTQRYETNEKAWREGFDPSNKVMCEYEDFDEVCKSIGYTADAKALFKQMLKDQGRKFLTIEDIEFQSMLVAQAVKSKSNIEN